MLTASAVQVKCGRAVVANDWSARYVLPMVSPSQVDLFWENTLAQLANEPLDASIAASEENLPYQKFEVTLRSLDGVRIRANLYKPFDEGNPRKIYPAVVTAPGYSGTAFSEMGDGCQRGYIILQVFPRMQGESATYLQPDAARGKSWLVYGAEDPAHFYYRGAFADLCRGVDYLLARDDVDHGRIGAIGASQGGFLALGLAAIDARVRAVAAHVPFLCDVRRNSTFDLRGGDGTYWGESKAPAGFFETFDYFDPVNLARRIHSPVALSSGGADRLCPADTIQAVYDQLPGIRSITHYPLLGHTPSPEFYAISWQWMQCYVKERY